MKAGNDGDRAYRPYRTDRMWGKIISDYRFEISDLIFRIFGR
jgi:hypothetical protein